MVMTPSLVSMAAFIAAGLVSASPVPAQSSHRPDAFGPTFGFAHTTSSDWQFLQGPPRNTNAWAALQLREWTKRQPRWSSAETLQQILANDFGCREERHDCAFLVRSDLPGKDAPIHPRGLDGPADGAVPGPDGPHVTVTPEPVTLLLLGSGLAGIGVVARRRRQNAGDSRTGLTS